MKKALGKGLNALIPNTYVNKKPEGLEEGATPKPVAPEGVSPESAAQSQAYRMVNIDDIIPNTEQPRQIFEPAGIDELAASIQEKGILEPVIVTELSEPGPEGEHYMLICGERRWKASRLCGLVEVPAVVKEAAPEDLLEWALIENIQREDLNPIEEAEAYRRLSEKQMLSQEDIAKRVGKDRSTVTNSLRLLRLPQDIREYLMEGKLTSGHARALLSLITPEHQRQLAKRIVQDNLSVRQTEAIVSRSNVQKRRARKARNLAPEIVDLETRLGHELGTLVRVYPKKNQKQGRIELHYYSLDDLDRILAKLGFKRD